MKNLILRILYLLLCVLISQALFAKDKLGSIKGIVLNSKSEPINEALIYLQDYQKSTVTDSKGEFVFENLPYGTYNIIVFSEGKVTQYLEVKLESKDYFLRVSLNEISQSLSPVTILFEKDKNFGRSYMNPIENFGIYEGKKTEVIEMAEVTANLSTNNARQVYAKITGLNIWESDGAGLQLGIGGRGLSPNRTANFNVRQNGYDISADALGYPESYYTPPLEAIERIELVRGAASLQYGTQFGGMLNFKFKRGPYDKPFELTTRQTVGSWGFLNSFNSIGGTVAKGKLNYYSYFQFKRGDGFRPNSNFDAYNGYLSMNYEVNKKLSLGLEITKMQYLAKQPGGLTDKNFNDNPRNSFRDRNWFQVDWNMAAILMTYEFNDKTSINIRNFGLLANRNALGNLERINVVDFGGNRTLISGDFRNVGSETRFLHRYNIGNQKQALLIGFRAYHGNTNAKQGEANAGSGAGFMYINPDNIENSDYVFSNQNYSLFLENIFNISNKWSLTPGLRIEHIGTFADGFFKQRVFDGAGNLIVENKIAESMGTSRNFLIGGIGSNYKFSDNLSLYANISQNYRAINFSDIRVVNPNFRVDPDIKDETGFTADIGLKAKKENYYNLELTTFLVSYNDKIGQVLRADQPPLFLDYRFRGNISDARNVGVEFFGELSLIPILFKNSNDFQWSIYVNFAYVDAKYINTEDNSIKNKQVEMVPPIMFRTGTQLKYKSFKAAFHFSHTAEHFSDATNAIQTSTAVEGIIPSYQVSDLSLSYDYKKYGVEASINNLFNQFYFTRRAEGYPGPGIIPSDGRSFFLTLYAKF